MASEPKRRHDVVTETAAPHSETLMTQLTAHNCEPNLTSKSLCLHQFQLTGKRVVFVLLPLGQTHCVPSLWLLILRLPSLKDEALLCSSDLHLTPGLKGAA